MLVEIGTYHFYSIQFKVLTNYLEGVMDPNNGQTEAAAEWVRDEEGSQ